MRLPKSLRAIVRVKRGLADPVREFVQRTPGGSRVVMALLARATHDEEATKIVVAWSELSSGPHRSRMPDKQFDWDAILERADISARDFIGICTRCAWDINIDMARGIMAMNYPAMMEASMKRAIENDGTREREIHFAATGHTPTPQGIQIGVQQTTNIDHDPDPGEAPSVGHTSRRVVRDLPPLR